MKNLYKIVLLIPILLLLSPKRELSNSIIFPLVPKSSLNNATIKTIANGKKVYFITDLSYQKNNAPLITDMVLSFNYPSSQLLQDDTKKYKIKISDYNFIKGKGALGRGCAEFYKKNHSVEIETVRNLWLGSCEDLGSFTIEFRFKAYSLYDSSILFSRIGYLSGKKIGIEIKFNHGRIIANLYNIFNQSGTDNIISFNKGTLLVKQKWYHFSLTFDRISGKLTKYLNNEEEETMYITKSKEPFNGVYMPSFGFVNTNEEVTCFDSPPAVIGKNYSGFIDEFRISYTHYDDLEKRTEIAYKNYKKLGIIGERIPYNTEGIITSPVYTFSDTGTRITLFKWNEILKKDTFIWMEFRISDHKFNYDDDILKWYRIKNNQRKIFLKKDEKGDFLRGKYYQWKAHLIPSPNGKYSPALYDIKINYQLDLPPNPPAFLEAVEAGNEYIVLKWKKNVDADIFGYKIYYGVHSDRYDGIISYINGKRITNEMAKGNYIEIKITKEIIEENRLLVKKDLLTFPLLKNTVLYYFSVSAYDSYKPDSPYNHESDLSKQISARPFAGSEID